MELSFQFGPAHVLGAMLKTIVDLIDWGHEVENEEWYVASAMVYANFLEDIRPHWAGVFARMEDKMDNQRFIDSIFRRDYYDHEASWGELMARETVLQIHMAINRRHPYLYDTGTYFTSIAYGRTEHEAVMESKSQVAGMPNEHLTV